MVLVQPLNHHDGSTYTSILKSFCAFDPVGFGLGKIKGRSTVGIRPALSITFLVAITAAICQFLASDMN